MCHLAKTYPCLPSPTGSSTDGRARPPALVFVVSLVCFIVILVTFSFRATANSAYEDLGQRWSKVRTERLRPVSRIALTRRLAEKVRISVGFDLIQCFCSLFQDFASSRKAGLVPHGTKNELLDARKVWQ